jgi:hypothetical protein
MRNPLPVLCLAGVSLSLLACGSSPSTPPSPKCMELATYMPTTLTPLSFMTDIYPIVSSTDVTNGCSMSTICHGSTAMKIDPGMTKDLKFVDPAATVKAALLMNSVHAPSMARVSPGNVGASFIAYKLSGKDGLACANSMCNANAGIGTPPCGDPMPSLGIITDADRTKILDWIAQGAAD